jgi:pimeloyl-ACP methyl ester carboxylesterase
MKETIILLHGALGAADQLKDLERELIDFKIYCPDFPGHGLKAGETFTISSLAEELHLFIEENKIDKCHIFGYSMGGYVALIHEIKYPGNIKSILTLGTKFNWNQETVQKETAMLQVDLMLNKIPEFCSLLERRHADKWKEVVENTANMMRQLAEDPILNHESLSNMNCKVVHGLGEKDTMVTLEETELIKLQIKGAVLDILPDTKHPIEQINTIELGSWVRKWLG